MLWFNKKPEDKVDNTADKFKTELDQLSKETKKVRKNFRQSADELNALIDDLMAEHK